jgi:hypothetical protein
MPNIVAAWLEMIGTQERAKRLLGNWTGDPAVVVLGQASADRAYAYAPYRAALDAWDVGRVDRRDLVIWAKHIISGKYKGPRLMSFIAGTTAEGYRMVLPLTVEPATVVTGSARRPLRTPPSPDRTSSPVAA